jgi:hypothetical protein
MTCTWNIIEIWGLFTAPNIVHDSRFNSCTMIPFPERCADLWFLVSIQHLGKILSVFGGLLFLECNRFVHKRQVFCSKQQNAHWNESKLCHFYTQLCPWSSKSEYLRWSQWPTYFQNSLALWALTNLVLVKPKTWRDDPTTFLQSQ